MATSSRHLSLSPDHGTPAWLVGAAREVLGTIYLDPATSRAHNKVVQATKIFTPKKDGLSQLWSGAVFLNPPGGKLRHPSEPPPKNNKNGAGKFGPKSLALHKEWRTKSSAVAWWRKLVVEHRKDVHSAIFVGFSIEILAAAQDPTGRWTNPLDYWVCVLRKRVAFTGTQPSHHNAVIYLGKNPERFAKVFSQFGDIVSKHGATYRTTQIKDPLPGPKKAKRRSNHASTNA